MNLHNLESKFKEKKNFRKIFYHDEVSKKEFQRLEFLGDRVLGIVLASELYKRYPEFNEGKLATIYSFLTSSNITSDIASKIDLDSFLKKKKFSNISNKVLADFMEAIIGSLFIDSGLKQVKAVIINLWSSEFVNSEGFRKDAKSFLQEWTQSKGLGLPVYNILEKQGLDHNPLFEIELKVKSYSKIKGKGKSLQTAEINTAKEFIKKFLNDKIIAK